MSKAVAQELEHLVRPTPIIDSLHPDVVAFARRHAQGTQDEIDAALNVLTLAGILHRKGKEFFFASPVFTKVLHQTYDLDYLFRKVKEERP